MTVTEINMKFRNAIKKNKQYKLQKLFKIYLLIEYELFKTGKTPQQLLEYYESQSVPIQRNENKTNYNFGVSYKTEYNIYNAKIEILTNMIKNKENLTPLLKIDE